MHGARHANILMQIIHLYIQPTWELIPGLCQ